MTKEQLENVIDGWQKILGLTNWEINITYKDQKKVKVGSFCTVMETTCYPEYCVAEIVVERLKSAEEKDIVHELIHILLSEFTDYAYEKTSGERRALLHLEERVVSQLSHIILRKIQK